MSALATITVGALAQQAGVDVAIIHSYERLGLIDKPRSAGGLRLYRTSDVARVTFVRRTQELGFSVEAIRELLGLTAKGRHTCGNVHERRRKASPGHSPPAGRPQPPGKHAGAPGGGLPENRQRRALSHRQRPLAPRHLTGGSAGYRRPLIGVCTAIRLPVARWGHSMQDSSRAHRPRPAHGAALAPDDPKFDEDCRSRLEWRREAIILAASNRLAKPTRRPIFRGWPADWPHRARQRQAAAGHC